MHIETLAWKTKNPYLVKMCQIKIAIDHLSTWEVELIKFEVTKWSWPRYIINPIKQSIVWKIRHLKWKGWKAKQDELVSSGDAMCHPYTKNP